MENLKKALVNGRCIVLENKNDFIEFCKLYGCFFTQYSSSRVLKESIKNDVILCKSIRDTDVSCFVYPLYVKYFDKKHLVLTNYFQRSDKPITMYEYLVKHSVVSDNKYKKTLIFVKNISHVDFYDSINGIIITMANGKVFNVTLSDRKEYLILVHNIKYSNTIEI